MLGRAFSTTPIRNRDMYEMYSPPPPPKPRSWPLRFIRKRGVRTLVFLALGFFSFNYLFDPWKFEPGGFRYNMQKSGIERMARRLPDIKALTADPAWTSWDAYESLTPEHRARHMLAGGEMSKTSGVGAYQRVFYKAETNEVVVVVKIGRSTTGWPLVVHGGLLATLVDETCGRAAFKAWSSSSKPVSTEHDGEGENTAVTGFTARLKINYKQKTLPGSFYVVRARVLPDEELPETERGKRHYKLFVDATVEDAITRDVKVKAEALFVGGRGKDGKGGKAPEWPREAGDATAGDKF
jgi:acyl-coenzyme A thioesterase PaaI-like protein